MKKHLRIHGDNIVECERIYTLIETAIEPLSVHRGFLSPACMSVTLSDFFGDIFVIDFFPGFNKNTNNRWTSNIFQLLKEHGGFLTETPDVLLTEVTPFGERLLLAIEFCSALQAGNQAWQRSGRAYSVARANLCPYLYIVDFVKYELDKNSRKRKNLRYPNAAIPFSYLRASFTWKYPTIQVYFRSEEFQPSLDSTLAKFDTSLFGEHDVQSLIFRLLYHWDVTPIYRSLMQKSIKVMHFMTEKNSASSYTKEDWERIQTEYGWDLLAFAKENYRFPFVKKIAKKSIVGHNLEFAALAKKYSIGVASKDLPFGLIPSQNRLAFARELCDLYPAMTEAFFVKLSVPQDLIVCMFKGFKPHGDDARPDRGILPFIAMLFSESIEIMTFVYGETLSSNLSKLDNNRAALAKSNGLWSSIISLSNFIILDAPLLSKDTKTAHVVRLLDNSTYKASILSKKQEASSIYISPYPVKYSENDIDSFMHTIFQYIIPNTFEGFCNPPGGDWSGISLVNSLAPENGTEFRWLTLPRVSANSKRPDHLVILFAFQQKPTILCVESKEYPYSLENDIGPALKKYISDLFTYCPSVERPLGGKNWSLSTSKISFEDFACASVGCFFIPINFELSSISKRCNCDILIGFTLPSRSNPHAKVSIQIEGFTKLGKELASYLIETIQTNYTSVNIFEV